MVPWTSLTLLVAVATLVMGLLIGRAEPGSPGVGPFAGWSLPVVRLLADLLGLLTIGLLVSAGFLLPSKSARLNPIAGRGVAIAYRAALLWAVAVAAEILLMRSDSRGVVPAPTLGSFVTQDPRGIALGLQLVIALVVAAVGRVSVTSRGAVVGSVLAALALAPSALTGHTADMDNRELVIATLAIHIVAASVWVGGLTGLAWAALATGRRRSEEEPGLQYALPRFSLLAGSCVVVVGLSGLVNAATRLGSLSAWVTTSFGVLVLVKLVALLVLAGTGGWHRRHTVRQLATEPTRTRPLFLRVAAVELIVMAGTFGVAVALSRSPLPVGTLRDVSPATKVLGFPLPVGPSSTRLAFGWLPDAFPIALVTALALLYAVGVVKLHRRTDKWPVGRILSWYVGLVIVAWATVGGLGLYSHVLFSAHMAAHMTLSMVAPIFLVLGAPITLALRTLPGPRVPGELGLRQMLMGVLHSGPVKVLSHPVVAALLFVGSLYALYFTPFFPYLMSDPLGHNVMELHFLLVGSVFFWVIVGIDPTPRRLPELARLGLLLVTMPFHAFFSIEIMSASTALAPDYFRALNRPYLTDFVADQHLGGGIGWGLGEVPLLLAVAALFVQWFRSDRRESARVDRAALRTAASTDPDAKDDLGRYNDYLASLSRNDAGDR